MLGVTLAELLSGLEAGDKLLVEPSRGPKDSSQGMKIQKLVRQLRVQQTAAERAVTSLEDIVFSSGARPSTTRRRKPGAIKSK